MALRVPPGSGELAFRDIARAWLVLLGWSGAACVEARPWTGAHFDRDDGGADAAVPDAAVPDAAIGDADYGLVPGPERDRPTPVTHSCAPPMGAAPTLLLEGLTEPRRIVARGAVAHVAEKTAAGMPGSFTYDAIWVTSRAADGTVTRDETAGDVAHLGDLGAVLNHPGGLLVVPWTGPSTVHLVGSAGTLKLLDGHLYWTSCQYVSSSECGLTLRRAPVADLAAVEDLQPLPRLYYLAVSAGWVFVGTSTHLWAAPLGGGEAQDHDLGAFVRGIAATSEGAYAVVETREERSGGQFMPNVFERMPEGSGILRIDPVSGARTWFLEETVVSAMVLTPSGAIVARRVPHWPTERPTVDSAGCTELVELDADGRPGRVLWRDLRDISALAVDEGVLYWARAPTFTLQQYVERSNGDAALYSMRIPP